jgi:hypothetical protein
MQTFSQLLEKHCGDRYLAICEAYDIAHKTDRATAVAIGRVPLMDNWILTKYFAADENTRPEYLNLLEYVRPTINIQDVQLQPEELIVDAVIAGCEVAVAKGVSIEDSAEIMLPILRRYPGVVMHTEAGWCPAISYYMGNDNIFRAILINASPTDLSDTDQDDRTPLDYALAALRLDRIQALLDHGADAEQFGKFINQVASAVSGSIPH